MPWLGHLNRIHALATPMFFAPNEFPFTAVLEARWQAIREEFQQLSPAQLMPWPETDIYENGWSVFGLWGVGQRFESHCRTCPETVAALSLVPGLTTAGFSRLAPGALIRPHEGYTDTVLRCHLGLIIPDGCGIQVGDEVRTWQEGKCLVFDDTVRHSAWNGAPTERIVLIVDFVREGKTFDPTVSQEAADVVKALLAGNHSAPTS